MLDELRKEIQAVDTQISELIAKRCELARQVGHRKVEQGLPVRDFEVEKIVLAKARERAVALGVNEDMLADIALSLIKGAIDIQVRERTRVRQKTHGTGEELCAIVGGAGKMGGWFDRFAGSLGYRTAIIEKGDRLEDGVKHADLIIVAVPLGDTARILEELLAIEPRGVVLEIASLKSPLVKTVQSAVARGSKVASIHPMFGPEMDLLSGQNVVVCRAGCPEAEDTAVAMFNHTAAQITELPLQQHDEFMTWVLNLPHLVSLAMGETLRASGLPLNSLTGLGSTTFSKQMRVTAEVMSENPELYYSIQRLNHHRDQLYEALRSSVDRIEDYATADNAHEFEQMMGQWRTYSEGDHD